MSQTAQEILINQLLDGAVQVGVHPHPQLFDHLYAVLCCGYSTQMDSFEFVHHGEAFAGVCAVLNEAGTKLRQIEYSAKKSERQYARAMRKEYSSAGSRISNDEVKSAAADRADADSWEWQMIQLEAVKNAAWSVRNLLTDRKDFLIEISRNRRREGGV